MARLPSKPGRSVKEITVVGSRCGPWPKAIALLRSGAVDPTPSHHVHVSACDRRSNPFRRSQAGRDESPIESMNAGSDTCAGEKKKKRQRREFP